MARRLAHLVQVVVLAAGADALLRRRGALVIALLGAEEDVFELVHPGVGEEQRRIVRREQRRRFDYLVPVPGEEVQECGSYFVSGHNVLPLWYSSGHAQMARFADDRQYCAAQPVQYGSE